MVLVHIVIIVMILTAFWVNSGGVRKNIATVVANLATDEVKTYLRSPETIPSFPPQSPHGKNLSLGITMPALKTKDFEYLNFIAEYRLLTNDMLAYIYDKSLRTVQNRISILDKMGLLSLSADNSKARRGKPRNIISLNQAGIEAVADTLDNDIRDIFYKNMNNKIIHIEHDLLTNLFRLHLIQLVRHTHNFSTEFISPTSPFLKGRPNGLPAISDKVTVDKNERRFVPDGVFSIYSKDENKRLLFFLESDRSSESMNGTTDAANLKTKLENYHHYLSCGGYKRYEKKWDFCKGRFNSASGGGRIV